MTIPHSAVKKLPRRLFSLGEYKFGNTFKRLRDEKGKGPIPTARDFHTLKTVYPNGVNMYTNRIAMERDLAF